MVFDKVEILKQKWQVICKTIHNLIWIVSCAASFPHIHQAKIPPQIQTNFSLVSFTSCSPWPSYFAALCTLIMWPSSCFTVPCNNINSPHSQGNLVIVTSPPLSHLNEKCSYISIQSTLKVLCFEVNILMFLDIRLAQSVPATCPAMSRELCTITFEIFYPYHPLKL